MRVSMRISPLYKKKAVLNNPIEIKLIIIIIMEKKIKIILTPNF